MERPPVPALSAATTARLLGEAGPGPGRLLELGGAGVHATPFSLAGWTVVVADTPERAVKARERTDAEVVDVDPAALPFADGEFEVVVVEHGLETAEAERVGRRVIQ